MSRSKKKTPITGNAGNSEKYFKKDWHGLERTIKRNQLKKVLLSIDDDKNDIWFPKKSEEIINIWSGPKDGKSYIPNWYRIDCYKKDKKVFDKYLSKMMRK